MSKGNMLLGYAQGKVGSMVFGRRNGQQITRPYNGSPRNPKTRAQMSQRIKWPNLVNMWRLLKPWISMGMQDKKTTQSDYNSFVSKNIGYSTAYMLKDEARAGATLLSDYIITSGTLGARTMSSALVTDIAVGSQVLAEDLAQLTIGELSAYIIANNAGFAVGDQITLLYFVQRLNAGLPVVSVAAVKFILEAPSATALVPAAMYSYGIELTVEGGYLAINPLGNTSDLAGGAVIQSRLVNGVLYVSDSRIRTENTAQPGQQTTVYGISKDEALASYGFNDAAFLSPNSIVAPELISASFSGGPIDGSSYVVPVGQIIVDVVGTNLQHAGARVFYGGISKDFDVLNAESAVIAFDVATGDDDKELTISIGDTTLKAYFTAE